MPEKRSKVFGIINVTPDSNSDSGLHLDSRLALEEIKNMVAAGVDVIDVGGEATRPGWIPITMKEEIRRLSFIPKIKEVLSGTDVKLSLDSRNYETIRYYINYIDIINDVTGLYDKRIRDLALDLNKKVILMHSLSVPVVIGEHIQAEDVVAYLKDWFSDKLNSMYSEGFTRDQIILDVGIGFGTSPEQSIEILKRIKEFMSFGIEVLVGHSRKSFLAQFGEEDPDKRDPETHVLTAYLADAGVHYLRLHDVDAGMRVMRLNKKLGEEINGLVTSLA